MTSPTGSRGMRSAEPVGRAALIASVGGQRGWADWANPTTGCGGCWPSSSAWPG
jgi:hypothetical protein